MSFQEHRSYVYILSSRSRTLYVGITSDLVRRVHQHKTECPAGFTSRYQIHRLVYFEEFGNVTDAVAREKQIKSWSRAKKVALIEDFNPTWDDLSAGWYADASDGVRSDG